MANMVAVRVRALMAAACALTAVGGAALAAPESVASPTSTVTTYLLNGSVLPVSPVSAGWIRVRPGCAGSLQAAGPAVSGTTTAVAGEFLSRAFRPRGGEVIDMKAQQGGRRLLQPLPEGFALSLRLRVVGHAWSSWWSLDVPDDPPAVGLTSLIYVGEAGGGFGFKEAPGRPGARLPMQQVQVRLHDTITSTGAINDGFDVRFGC